MPIEIAIEGVRVIPLIPQGDVRGELVAVVSPAYWPRNFAQFNLVRSLPGTLRGMHAHANYAEYYVPVAGRMFFVIKDARAKSPTFGCEMSLWVEPEEQLALELPIGVAHAVYFPDGGTLGYGLSEIWTGAGDQACRWDDPAIETAWPFTDPILSDRDIHAGSFAAMVDALRHAG